jgi:hypothetical protein
MSPLGEAALALGRRGLRVFPCWPRRKEPAVRDNLRLAAIDEAIIRRFWGEHGAYNVAIATGAGSRIWVLDVDADDGGEATLSALEAKHGPLPRTVEAITANGRHLYFRWPDNGLEIRNRQERDDLPGVHVRGEGGYVLAPPSIHPSGRAYAWSVDSASEFADAPQWLIDIVKSDRSGDGGDEPQATPSGVWRDLLDCDHEGSRRETAIARVAGLLLRRYVDPFATLGLCHIFNERRCREPLARTEVVRIVGNIAERELGRRQRAELAAEIQQSGEA